MRGLVFSFALAVLALIAPGCESGNSPAGDAEKTSVEIKGEVQTLAASDLQKVVRRYNDEIAKLQEKIKAVDPSSLGQMKAKDILGEEGQKVLEGSRDLKKELIKLKERRAIYTDELSGRK